MVEFEMRSQRHSVNLAAFNKQMSVDYIWHVLVHLFVKRTMEFYPLDALNFIYFH